MPIVFVVVLYLFLCLLYVCDHVHAGIIIIIRISSPGSRACACWINRGLILLLLFSYLFLAYGPSMAIRLCYLPGTTLLIFKKTYYYYITIILISSPESWAQHCNYATLLAARCSNNLWCSVIFPMGPSFLSMLVFVVRVIVYWKMTFS